MYIIFIVGIQMIYSKHQFVNNKYDNINPGKLDNKKTNEYCLKIALS